jgi:hypothetical protein
MTTAPESDLRYTKLHASPATRIPRQHESDQTRLLVAVTSSGPTNSPARHPEMRISIAGLAKTSAANTHRNFVRSRKGHARTPTHSSLAHTFFVCLLSLLALFRSSLWRSLEPVENPAMKELHALVVCLLVHPPRRDDEVCQLPKRELEVLRAERQLDWSRRGADAELPRGLVAQRCASPTLPPGYPTEHWGAEVLLPRRHEMPLRGHTS